LKRLYWEYGLPVFLSQRPARVYGLLEREGYGKVQSPALSFSPDPTPFGAYHVCPASAQINSMLAEMISKTLPT
jgi:hypothetical protein